MTILDTAVDPRDPSYLRNRGAMLERLTELDCALDAARSGGGERDVTRHHARGKLLPRERIELLLDQDAPFLELSSVAAWGTDFQVGAGLVSGIGVVEGVECVVAANDPTVRGGAVNPYTLRKARRAGEIAYANRLPMINLVESSGMDLTAQADVFLPGGAILRDLTRLSAAGVPTVAVVFGDAAGIGAHLSGLSDYRVLVRNQARLSLALSVPARMTNGDILAEDPARRATARLTQTGFADFVAEDERDAIRLVRQCVRRANRRKQGPPPRTAAPLPPRHDCEDLLAIASADGWGPYDPREVLARILDGSDFDEFKPGYGTGLVTGWGELHGYPLGVLANAGGELSAPDAEKGARFIQLANAHETPLLFLQNTTGFQTLSGEEQSGVLEQSAVMISAVVSSAVPHLTITIGASYGTANYGMCGRAYEPRFLFAWPGSRSAAVVVPAQLGDHRLEQRLDTESGTLYLSGRLYDDGVIDPRDTRTVLGICLSAIHSAPIRGAAGFGFGGLDPAGVGAAGFGALG